MENKLLQDIIIKATGASSAYFMEDIQSLWSGYGKIVRYGVNGADCATVVVKHVQLMSSIKHGRGGTAAISHQRKLRSYQVETAWYQQYSHRCDHRCRIPECLLIEMHSNEVIMVLEDLDGAGFGKRRNSISWAQVEICLNWLANFHALFMGEAPHNLWSTGTYWHLETRPDELRELSDEALRVAAPAIDRELSQSPFQTFVHGDAKLANFCFSDDGKKVAAVDFQYVGGGCGMKDVAYFVSSCMGEEDCEKHETKVLDYYFSALNKAIQYYGKRVDFNSLEADWRELYHVAWTDFHRFLKGWSPGHWRFNTYSERVARNVVSQINKKK